MFVIVKWLFNVDFEYICVIGVLGFEVLLLYYVIDELKEGICVFCEWCKFVFWCVKVCYDF